MKITAVSARQSSDFINAALSGREKSIQEDARRLLRIFHEKHVGVPPTFAADVVAGFAYGRPAEADNPLRLRIYQRLQDTIGTHQLMRQNATRFDILPRHIIVEICIHPLAVMVIEEIGELFLFSRSSDEEHVDQLKYEAYVERFNSALEALCASAVAPFEQDERWTPKKADLFWERIAHQLWAEVQRKKSNNDASRRTPLSESISDSLSLRMICGLEPAPTIELDSEKRMMELANEQNPDFKYPKQGGVYGIHATSRLDDLEDMLVSEFIVPRPVLADKLLNGVYLAKHRPPPFDERRQLVVLGTVLDEKDCAEAIALAKSCWLDAVFRFSIVLFKNGLLNSELRFGQWLEGAGHSSTRIRVGNFSQLSDMDPVNAGRSEMRRFFCEAGWLPGFLSLLPDVSRLRSSISIPRESDGWFDRLQYMTDQLLSEDRWWDEKSEARFDRALSVSFRKVTLEKMETSSLAALAPAEAMPIGACMIDCPAKLTSGAAFVYHDQFGREEKIDLNGEVETLASKKELERVAAALTKLIFDFYWNNMDA